LTIICCCQVQNYIYWIISTENDHRHHHQFIKYETQLGKEGNMPRLTYQAKSLPLQREFGRVALPSVRSNGPTDPLHISCFCSICTSIPLSLWIRQSPLSSTRWHFLFAQEPHVVYCF
jgi:hypothetical protein